ncbi:MAG TPA: response regulator, partial [Polyangiaceae bacterium]|nr:response regulator [Polyangiaceae bacterium]
MSENLPNAGESLGGSSVPAAARVLLVDDDPDVLDALARRLRAAGFDVSAHGSAASALAALRCGGFDVAVSDIAMPEMDGLG